MSYQRKYWKNDETKVNATNMNNIEDGIEEALDRVAETERQITKIHDLIKTEETKVYINKGFTPTYTLAQEFDSTQTYYEAYKKITPSELHGTWVYKENNVRPSDLNETFEVDTVRTPVGRLKYISYMMGNYGKYYYYDEEGNRIDDPTTYPIWIGTSESGSVNLGWCMSVTEGTSNLHNWLLAYYNKVSDNVLDENITTLEDLETYDELHPSYRVIELTEETFIPNKYYTCSVEPQWEDVADLGEGGGGSTERIEIELANLKQEVANVKVDVETLQNNSLSMLRQIDNLNKLIKADENGNVFVNLGYIDTYAKAYTFDPNQTYYEAYVPLDTNKLKGTWKGVSYQKPSGMYSFSKSFTVGTVLTTFTWHPDINATFERYVTGINTTGYCSVVNFDGSDAGSGPMFIQSDWNMCNQLSFKTEIDAATLQFVKAFYTKMSDSVIEEEGKNTIALLQAWDREHPSYRIIELTQETFVPDTYYVKTSVPNWVNIKTLQND